MNRQKNHWGVECGKLGDQAIVGGPAMEVPRIVASPSRPARKSNRFVHNVAGGGKPEPGFSQAELGAPILPNEPTKCFVINEGVWDDSSNGPNLTGDLARRLWRESKTNS